MKLKRQETAVLRQMAAISPAQIVNLGVVDFTSITADTLASLAYSTTPIDGNNDATNRLVAGDVFAVRTNQGNYAKVKVLSYGYNLQIQWVTYQLASPYVVLGTGYQQPEDVKASIDGTHVYVTERTGDLLKVQLASANRSAATILSSGMTAPQQLYLDEAHNAAYVVEYALAKGDRRHPPARSVLAAACRCGYTRTRRDPCLTSSTTFVVSTASARP